MTLEELRTIVADVVEKAETLHGKTMRLKSFMNRISTMVNDEQFSSTINVDPFVAIQTPLYLALLHDIEVAADALGTDLA